jgi:hypothetical protein
VRRVTFRDLGHPLFVATTSPPLAQLPDLTPAPAVLRALADVGEVDLAEGLGRRRLAEVARFTGPLDPPRRRRRPRLAWLLLALAGLLLLLAVG